MSRFLATLALFALLMPADVHAAGQKVAVPTIQNLKLTTEQIISDCAFTGVLFSAATVVGLLKPATIAVHSVPMFSLVHEAFYGCGIGVVSSFVGHKLTELLLALPLDDNAKPENGATTASAPAAPVAAQAR